MNTDQANRLIEVIENLIEASIEADGQMTEARIQAWDRLTDWITEVADPNDYPEKS